MTRSRKYTALWTIGLLAGAALCSLGVLSARGPELRRVSPVAQPGQPINWLGVGSCASSACHGDNPKYAGQLKCAVTLWTRDDPHAKSFMVLFSERSKRMLASYKGLNSLADAKPESEALCLKCHAMHAEKSQQGEKFDVTEGVGCEACHGASGKWQELHMQSTWKSLTDDERAAQGMYPIHKAGSRAMVCTSCHLGAPDREVNHDLIAAGHPALYMDLSAQNSRMPPHWGETRSMQQADFDARLWVASQVGAVRQSLLLLEARATDSKRPWPEFAEYDCLACHQSLKLLPTDKPLPKEKNLVGSTPYAGWNQDGLRVLASAGPLADPAIAKQLDDLSKEMSRLSPNRTAVANQAKALAGKLQPYLNRIETLPLDKAEVKRLLRAVAQNAGQKEIRWTKGFQLGSSLTALNKALGKLDPAHPGKEIDADLKALRDAYPAPVKPGDFLKINTKPQSVDNLLKPILSRLP